jgi:hypothetical protein
MCRTSWSLSRPKFKFDKGGKVEKGPRSDDDHEKESVSSAGSDVFLGFQPQHNKLVN